MSRGRNKKKSASGSVDRGGAEDAEMRNSVSVADDSEHESENSNTDDAACISCKKTFADLNKLVQCDRCDGWTCQSCSGMSKDQWRCNVTSVSKAKGHRKMSFFCDRCQPQALKEVKMGNLIDEKCKAMQEEIEAFKREVNDRLDKELGKVKKDVDEIRHQMTDRDRAVEDKISERVNEKMSDCGRLSVQELQEREVRKENLIFINIPESQKETAEERITEDTKKIEAILMELKEVAIFKKPIRLGQKSEKPRPMKIRFDDNTDATRVVKAAKKLKYSKYHSDIYISRDMTPLERDDWRKLVKEKKEKIVQSQEEGDNTAVWIIRRGKVVKVSRDATLQPQATAAGEEK